MQEKSHTHLNNFAPTIKLHNITTLNAGVNTNLGFVYLFVKNENGNETWLPVVAEI